VTVHLPNDCRTWRYNFYFQGERQFGSTGQSTKEGAEAFEAKLRGRLQREFEEAELRRAAGIETVPADQSPFITDWAGEYMTWVESPKSRITRPGRVDDLLRVVLRFWGGKPSGKDPKNPIVEDEPYNDLRLIDPIRDPDRIVDFEDWMDRRGVSGQTKNQYRSVMCQLYKHASQPQHRKLTGVMPNQNPFVGIYRDDGNEREVTIAPEDLLRLLEHAGYHVRLTVAIGALAPKLRLQNILDLRWSTSFVGELEFITVAQHKTVKHTKKPLVIPISAQLREILRDARRRAPRARPGKDYVVTYRGQAVQTIRGGIKGAAKAAGLPYGRFTEDGLTFHTLRHTAATIMAQLDVAEGKRKSVMGHKRLETTQKYTHLRPVHEVETVEQLSDALPIKAAVMQPWRRPTRARPVSEPVQRLPQKATKPRAKSQTRAVAVRPRRTG
jgi:integrase